MIGVFDAVDRTDVFLVGADVVDGVLLGSEILEVIEGFVDVVNVTGVAAASVLLARNVDGLVLLAIFNV